MGRRSRVPLPSRAMIVAMGALVVGLCTTGYAATGGNFILGKSNTADKTTKLTSTTPTGAAVAVTNSGPGRAASFTVNPGVPPFSVNSNIKVGKLNADLLDGLDSSDFVQSSALRMVGPTTVAAPPNGSSFIAFATVGHFTFTGLCARSPGGDRVTLTISSDTAHSAYASQTQAVAGSQFGSGDFAGTATLADVSAAVGTPDINPISGSAIAADGQQVVFSLYQTMNARAVDGQCAFGGMISLT